VSTAIFAETLDNSQHSTLLIPKAEVALHTEVFLSIRVRGLGYLFFI
jgi:hypothetical protein